MCFSSDESNRLHEDDVTWTTSSFTTGSSSKNIYIVLHIPPPETFKKKDYYTFLQFCMVDPVVGDLLEQEDGN